MKALTLILSFCIIAGFSQASRIPTQLQNESPKLNQTQLKDGICSYAVKIKTSCKSSYFNRDHISLVFGDAYEKQVYVEKLEDPYFRRFRSCSTDRFQIQGPCTQELCYLYIRQTGKYGWIPLEVELSGNFESQPPFRVNYFNDDVTSGTWKGRVENECYDISELYSATSM